MTEFRTLKEVADDPQTTLHNDLNKHFSSKEGDEITCICCGKRYKRGYWNFYNLCDPCFVQFNQQKMRARMGAVAQFLGGKEVKVKDATESAEEFVSWKRCTHEN